jgi:HAD superfamily hydrolase (TIGR01509 family)
MDSPQLRGIVLDFDGLIVDTETPVFQAWQAEARLLGADLDLATFATVVGRHCSQAETVQLLLGAEYLPRTDEIYQRVRERKNEATERTVARDGIPALVKDIRARRLPLGIASSSPHSWVAGHLERLGLAGSFDAIRGSDDVGGRSKPAPDVYLAALDALGLKASEALAVEDSVSGMTAAQAAGLRCVAAPGPITAGYDFSAADAFMPTLAGIDVAGLAAAVGMRA